MAIIPTVVYDPLLSRIKLDKVGTKIIRVKFNKQSKRLVVDGVLDVPIVKCLVSSMELIPSEYVDAIVPSSFGSFIFGKDALPITSGSVLTPLFTSPVVAAVPGNIILGTQQFGGQVPLYIEAYVEVSLTYTYYPTVKKLVIETGGAIEGVAVITF